jgi:hypothetical protein
VIVNPPVGWYGATYGAGVVGVVAAEVAGARDELAPDGRVVDADRDVEGEGVAVTAFVDAFVDEAALPRPTCAARPANSPVPVSAPASDQRVTWAIRRSPASRALRLRVVTERLLGMHR